MTRLSFDGHSLSPVWSPDGAHIALRSVSDRFNISWVRSSGAGEPQQLLHSENVIVPWSFSPDGRRLAYHEFNPETGYDIWTLPLDTADPDHPKPGKPEPFLRTPFDELVPAFSPDGRWIAYRSNVSGSAEICVQPFSATGGKWQISSGGGLFPFWSKNGHELFYETPDNRIMAVDYTVNGDSFAPGKPRLWSEKQVFHPSGLVNLDLAPDGKRFAVPAAPETATPEKGSVHVIFLLNFFDELKRRVPAGGK
jgi:serine/threonine-protein kinase